MRNHIYLKKGMEEENRAAILAWTNERGADFLQQYAGNTWTYPLTEEQIFASLDTTYSIYLDTIFVGMIQIMKREKCNVHVGRFLLDPDKTGHGIGSETLMQFCEMLLREEGTNSVTLCVYEFNHSARKCYEKCGFAVLKRYEEGEEPTFFLMKKEPGVV